MTRNYSLTLSLSLHRPPQSHRIKSSTKSIMSSAKSRSSSLNFLMLSLALLIIHPFPSSARKRHVINFRSPDLYPDGLTWDPAGQHFLVGSLHSRTIHSVSDAGVVQTLVSDADPPENATILGLAVDSAHGRLLAVIHSAQPLPPLNALAAYDLRSRGRRIFLSLLPSLPGDDATTGDVANDVAVDFKGNAYVTNSVRNFIWKVNREGEASIFSRSPILASQPLTVDRNAPFSGCGLNGITYVSKGYLLVVQSNTGKMYKVDEEDGTARLVLLNRDLTWADGIALRRDGVVLVVSHHRLWFLKSQDSWSEGVVYDETAVDKDGFATSVVVGAEDRVYVLYGRVMEGLMGKKKEGLREWFGIEEVRSEKESGEEKVWVYVLIGLGLVYFCVWRLQMRHLITSMDKKTN